MTSAEARMKYDYVYRTKWTSAEIREPDNEQETTIYIETTTPLPTKTTTTTTQPSVSTTFENVTVGSGEEEEYEDYETDLSDEYKAWIEMKTMVNNMPWELKVGLLIFAFVSFNILWFLIPFLCAKSSRKRTKEWRKNTKFIDYRRMVSIATQTDVENGNREEELITNETAYVPEPPSTPACANFCQWFAECLAFFCCVNMWRRIKDSIYLSYLMKRNYEKYKKTDCNPGDARFWKVDEKVEIKTKKQKIGIALITFKLFIKILFDLN